MAANQQAAAWVEPLAKPTSRLQHDGYRCAQPIPPLLSSLRGATCPPQFNEVTAEATKQSGSRHSGMVRQHQTSDAQLRIAESLDSGLDAFASPRNDGC
jgi:hypothetical protein